MTDPGRIAEELRRRESLWEELNRHGDPERIQAAVIRELHIYKTQRGIFFDGGQTRGIVRTDSPGIAVAVKHSGRDYPDSLSPDGAGYHYPATKSLTTDANEIQSLRDAGEIGAPVFFIEETAGKRLRRVRRCWVAEEFPEQGLFYLTFGAGEQPMLDAKSVEDQPFELTESASPRKKTTVESRPGQARFRIQVLDRYGVCCALCDVRTQRLLEAAHIVPKHERGSDDPRNGLPLCRNHHQALDCGLIRIAPEPPHAVTPGPKADSDHPVGILRSDLSHLPRQPHPDALRQLSKLLKR